MAIQLLNDTAPASLKSTLNFPTEILQITTAEPEQKQREFLWLSRNITVKPNSFPPPQHTAALRIYKSLHIFHPVDVPEAEGGCFSLF